MKINERESSHVVSHADSDNNITQGSASAGDLGVNWHHEHGISSWFITPMEMDVFRSPSLVMLPAWKEWTPVIIAATELVKDTCK